MATLKTYEQILDFTNDVTRSYLQRRFPKEAFYAMLYAVGLRPGVVLPSIHLARSAHADFVGCYWPSMQAIELNPGRYKSGSTTPFTRNRHYMVMAHEMRHHYQNLNGLFRQYYRLPDKSQISDNTEYLYAYNQIPYERDANIAACGAVDQLISAGVIRETDKPECTVEEYYRGDYLESRKTKENYFLSYNP